MINEIFIKNTKLKLSRLVEYRRGTTNIDISSRKRKMRYQQVLTIISKTSCIINSTCGLVKINVTGDGDEAWIMERSNTKYEDTNPYTKEEFRILGWFIIMTYNYGYLKMCEDLCLSTKNENVIEGFYKTYGSLLKTSPLSVAIDSYEEKTSSRKFSSVYGRNKYSIYHLLRDLEKDEAEVLIDKELIGAYKRISRSKKIAPSNISYLTSGWNKVYGLLGNKERANISLNLISKVSVNIPQNDVGIQSGPRILSTFKTINVIKDGVPHIDSIGVKVSKELALKLKRVRCVDMPLFYDNELLIDLRRLPIISRAEIKPISSTSLAKLEVETFLAKIAVEFYDKLVHKNEFDKTGKRTQIQQTKDKIFLKSLGIVGDTYSPINEKPVKEGVSYDSKTYISCISGLPTGERLRKALNYTLGIISYGKQFGSDIKNLDKFLSTLDRTKPEDSLRHWKSEYDKLYKELKRKKFELILSKKVRFTEKGHPRAYGIRKIYKDTDKLETELVVTWNFKHKTINI